MKFEIITLSLLICAVIAPLQTKASNIEQSFLNPPDTVRPQIYWMQMNANISKEGITADLEAMKRARLGGFQTFHLGHGIPDGNVGYMSEQWHKLTKHAIDETIERFYVE
jgi:hypothetical protein